MFSEPIVSCEHTFDNSLLRNNNNKPLFDHENINELNAALSDPSPKTNLKILEQSSASDSFIPPLAKRRKLCHQKTTLEENDEIDDDFTSKNPDNTECDSISFLNFAIHNNENEEDVYISHSPCDNFKDIEDAELDTNENSEVNCYFF